MLDKQLQAEHDLAIALGWTNLIEVVGTLLGTPPDGGASSRGQAAVPAWTRDWNACGPLLGQHEMCINCMSYTVIARASTTDKIIVPVNQFPSKDDAIRYAIVVTTTAAMQWHAWTIASMQSAGVTP